MDTASPPAVYNMKSAVLKVILLLCVIQHAYAHCDKEECHSICQREHDVGGFCEDDTCKCNEEHESDDDVHHHDDHPCSEHDCGKECHEEFGEGGDCEADECQHKGGFYAFFTGGHDEHHSGNHHHGECTSHKCTSRCKKEYGESGACDADGCKCTGGEYAFHTSGEKEPSTTEKPKCIPIDCLDSCQRKLGQRGECEGSRCRCSEGLYV